MKPAKEGSARQGIKACANAYRHLDNCSCVILPSAILDGRLPDFDSNPFSETCHGGQCPSGHTKHALSLTDIHVSFDSIPFEPATLLQQHKRVARKRRRY